MDLTQDPTVALVVVARDEEARIGKCLESVAALTPAPEVFFSDNGSVDATGEVAASFAGRIQLTSRRVDDLGPSEHFVSTARWALTSSGAQFFAFLAGDDTRAPDFLAEALRALESHPEVCAAFPRFEWEGGDWDRSIEPVSLLHSISWIRRSRALALPDSREVANLAYGLFRRAAFVDLVDAWDRGEELFGADYAAVIGFIGRHRVAAVPSAVAYRNERAGADLIERVGFTRSGTESALQQAALYVRLNIRVNSALARAIAQERGSSMRRALPSVQLVRAPGWIFGAVGQARRLLRSRGQ